MNINQVCILTGGILSVLMMLFHTRFYHLFQWDIDFQKIGSTNQKIFYTIHIALILLFLIFSLVSFVYIKELSQPKGLAFGVLLFYSLFWLWRTIWQMIYFKPSKGKGLRKLRIMHYILIIWFTMLFLAYAIPVTIKIHSLFL